MSDFKFSCPVCGQHLSGDVRYAGMQISCPACQQTIAVPGEPAVAAVPVGTAAGGSQLRMSAPAASGSTPPGPPPATRPTAAKQRTSGLAIASLVCSIGSFVIIPLGFIPGIICGHMARKALARDRTLAGHGLAKAGLIIGYIALTINVLVLLAVLAFVFFVGTRIQLEGQPMPGSPPSQSTGRDQRVGPRGGTQPGFSAQSEEPAVAAAADPIADRPLAGTIRGSAFRPDRVELDGKVLKFRQGAGPGGEMEVDITLSFDELSDLNHFTTIHQGSSGFDDSSRVIIKQRRPGADGMTEEPWAGRFGLRIEFESLAGGRLPGRVYLGLVDAQKSTFSGRFVASLKGQAGAR